MNLNTIYAAAAVAGLLVLLTYYRLGYGVVRLVRRWLRLLAQVTSTVLAAQIVGLVFVVNALQQEQTLATSSSYLTDAARSLTYGALISILGLFLILIFAATVQRRKHRRGRGPAPSSTERLVMASVVLGIAFTGLVHLSLMLPLILLEPLL